MRSEDQVSFATLKFDYNDIRFTVVSNYLVDAGVLELFSLSSSARVISPDLVVVSTNVLLSDACRPHLRTSQEPSWKLQC